MTFDGALIREGGVTFGIAVVRDAVLDSPRDCDSAIQQFSLILRAPTVIMGDRSHRTYGRPDLVNFLRGVALSQIPWQRYTIN